MARIHQCPVCHSIVPEQAKKCRHCHYYLRLSWQYIWEESVRMLGLVAVVVAAIVAWKSLEFTVVAERQKEEALAQVSIVRREHDALKEDLYAPSIGTGFLQSEAATAQEKTLHKAWEASTDLRVRKALAKAVELQGQHLKFRMGGKSPEEGFDSSGFISYLLAEAGAIDPLYQRTFSVARLEKSFKKVKEAEAKSGDLVFLGGSFVAMNLGKNQAVGIGGTKGIQVFAFSAKSDKTFYRWAYGVDAKLLK